MKSKRTTWQKRLLIYIGVAVVMAVLMAATDRFGNQTRLLIVKVELDGVIDEQYTRITELPPGSIIFEEAECPSIPGYVLVDRNRAYEERWPLCFWQPKESTTIIGSYVKEELYKETSAT